MGVQGIFAVLLAVTAVMAWHRAEVFVNATNCSCDRRRVSKALHSLSLDLLFPINFSAFSLAEMQQQARTFIALSALLRLGSFINFVVRVFSNA